jgi:hypothetical protein
MNAATSGGQANQEIFENRTAQLYTSARAPVKKYAAWRRTTRWLVWPSARFG